ncbi:chaperonin 10-like protein [Talaromyces proteolyticus]|uniref:Chaperonin 10-like protein n=1 Tax=Talaromyces proteolyticus TaxID=1131652 RepID=A0AAD4L3K0_9EURO|nr:chaperonin 10-like protein [Talaromyces proteolyticus]KAH8703974.1 chaperonin 10-like protein [Talaromyces proteolyticus]
MYEVVIHSGPKAEVVQSPIPKPKPDQLVIKVIVSGSNPKDWKYPEWTEAVINQGDDIAGIVHEVGSGVTEFKIGARVAAFHEMATPGGSYAEYAVSWAHTTFHLPEKTTYEEASTIPLAALTASLALFGRLSLPTPFSPAKEKIPLIIYGGSSAVGAFAIKLAQKANIHPLFVVAGSGTSFVEKLIDSSKGDRIIDYRPGIDHVVDEIYKTAKASGEETIKYALDSITLDATYGAIAKVLDSKEGQFTGVLPFNENVFPSTVTTSMTNVGSVHSPKVPGDEDLGFVFSRLFSKGLKEGWFSGHPHEVVRNGLEGVEEALKNLKDGKNSASKYVFRVKDTPGLK